MKQQTIINILAGLYIAADLAMTILHKQPEQTQPINYELYDFQVGQIQDQGDTLKVEFKLINDEITKDSLLVVGAVRSKRDSLRAIINPR